MSYMLREEAFHMGTGNDGLRRIVQAGIIPGWLIQKYLNKWISCSYDLFGTDHSSSAHWAYVWGIKGRYDELKNETPAKLDELNDYNRRLYRDEVAGLVDRLNGFRKAGEAELYAPDIRFNRAIGQFAGQKFHAKTGVGSIFSPNFDFQRSDHPDAPAVLKSLTPHLAGTGWERILTSQQAAAN